MSATADAFFGIFGMKRVEPTMTDHRTIPGIEFVPCPGPLRAGDYVHNGLRGDGVAVIAKVTRVVRPHSDPCRVIPVVRPLEVPEEATIASLDELEVCTVKSGWTGLMHSASCDATADDDGMLINIGPLDGDDLAGAINTIARYSRGAK